MPPALVAIQHVQLRRFEAGDLPAQLATDAATGAGDQHPPAGDVAGDGIGIDVGGIATQQVFFADWAIKLIKRGAPTVTRNVTTNAQGKATVWVNTSRLRPGTYKITAFQPSCDKYAQSTLTFRGRHNDSDDDDDDDRDDLGVFDPSGANAIGALTAGMEARAAALADRAPIAAAGAALSAGGSTSDGVPALQLALVTVLCGSGLLAVNTRRRRSLAVV